MELFLYPSAQDLRLLATVGYCVKCKAKREMKGERQIIMKNGRPATTGTCTVCGTKMFKIGGGGGGGVKAKAKKSTAKKKTKGKKKK
ncbi:MAG TPA: DUF5679 domain-containing protein [Nitrososphaera sp.]|jgi:hypothetical protein|nr:DUF5679 domain-containing protein [Nitrososphaera sp.]